jgi:uncharacterized membrane protein YoaK (UPF0700 family)
VISSMRRGQSGPPSHRGVSAAQNHRSISGSCSLSKGRSWHSCTSVQATEVRTRLRHGIDFRQGSNSLHRRPADRPSEGNGDHEPSARENSLRAANQVNAGTRAAHLENIRDILAIGLALVTGATDAIGFTRLGGVFTSVMTGNMVLLGVAGGDRNAALALHAGAAFIGYVLGTLVGARVAGKAAAQQSVWPRPITVALLFELAVFAIFAVWWELAGGHPSGAATYVLIASNALALGVQSSAVLRFGISGLSTTYLTGTLTETVANLIRRHSPLPARRVAILIAVVIGAGLGALLAVNVPRAAPAVPLGVLALVVLGAMASFRGPGVVPVAESR